MTVELFGKLRLRCRFVDKSLNCSTVWLNRPVVDRNKKTLRKSNLFLTYPDTLPKASPTHSIAQQQTRHHNHVHNQPNLVNSPVVTNVLLTAQWNMGFNKTRHVWTIRLALRVIWCSPFFATLNQINFFSTYLIHFCLACVFSNTSRYTMTNGRH